MTQHPRLRVMIAGGGTGGHLFPGVALAERVKAAGGEVCFVGTAKGIEARVLPEDGWPLELMEVTGIKGRGLRGLFGGLSRLPRAYFQSRAILKRFRPDVVVGVGGYASGPVVFTARTMGIKTAILEQNSVPGVTNRILGRVVHRVYTTFPDEAGHFPPSKILQAGNPIRLALLERLVEAKAAIEGAPRPPRLFVFGGSQGAKAINDASLAMVGALRAAHPELELWHQCGKADHERVVAAYEAAGHHGDWLRVVPFIRDMAEPYAWADMALCRAGATSLAELSAVGCPAILIPFPHATDNHQEHNARALVDAGAAVLVRESELDPAALAERISTLLGDRERLAQMRAAMDQAARPLAAESILNDLGQLSGVSGG